MSLLCRPDPKAAPGLDLEFCTDDPTTWYLPPCICNKESQGDEIKDSVEVYVDKLVCQLSRTFTLKLEPKDFMSLQNRGYFELLANEVLRTFSSRFEKIKELFYNWSRDTDNDSLLQGIWKEMEDVCVVKLLVFELAELRYLLKFEGTNTEFLRLTLDADGSERKRLVKAGFEASKRVKGSLLTGNLLARVFGCLMKLEKLDAPLQKWMTLIMSNTEVRNEELLFRIRSKRPNDNEKKAVFDFNEELGLNKKGEKENEGEAAAAGEGESSSSEESSSDDDDDDSAYSNVNLFKEILKDRELDFEAKFNKGLAAACMMIEQPDLNIGGEIVDISKKFMLKLVAEAEQMEKGLRAKASGASGADKDLEYQPATKKKMKKGPK